MNPNEIELTPEETRREAETRSLTLEPLHPGMLPEDEPDSLIAAKHVNGPAIANASNDIEQDSPLVESSRRNSAAQVNSAATNTHVKFATIATLVFIVSVTLAVILYALT